MNTHRPRLSIATGLAAALLALLPAGCDPGADSHDGHDHGAEADQAHGSPEDEHGAGEPADEHADEVHLSAEAIERYGLRTEAVTRRLLVPMFRVPAQVAFNTEGIAHVGIPVEGRVLELRVRLGDEVQKGDVLLVVESPALGEAQSDYLLKRSATANSGPAVELAKNAHERAQALYDKNQGIALTEVQRREVEYRAAVAALAGARAAEDAAKSRLHLLGMADEAIELLATGGKIDAHFTVFAPIGGRVIEREVTLGHLVGPEIEKLLVLADMTKLWVVANVPQTRLADIAIGAKTRVLLGNEGDHWCEGVVSFISPALDPATRTVQVRIEPTDRHDELRPGVFAQAEIESAGSAASEPVLAVPDSATQVVEGELSVFVLVPGEENTFAKRTIVVGSTIGGFVAVLSGLAEGEHVVTEGSFLLKAELGKASAEHQH